MKTRDFFWHARSNRLVEYCYSYKERVTYIRTYKPINEQELRLRLFKPVKGRLPALLIKAEFAHDKAWDVYIKAKDTYNRAVDSHAKAWDTYETAWNASAKAKAICIKASDTRFRAWDAYSKASSVYRKARDVYEKAFTEAMPTLLKLHARECKNCPWDGKTIFPQ